MPHCHKCDKEFVGDLTSCPNCGEDFNNKDKPWVMIGKIYNKISSDFAQETLETNGIPVTIISESGFFGNIGLNLPSFSGKGMGKFRVHVPGEFAEEANGLLEMTLGDIWEKAEED